MTIVRVVILAWSTNDDASRTSAILDGLYDVLLNYGLYQRKVEKLKSLVDKSVKPAVLSEIEFLF